jgi:ABC-type polysaccharide/polyol phosphate export permease
MMLLTLGIGMLLSAYALRFKDVGHLWSVCTQVLFWLTPIMYPYAADRPIWQEVVSLRERFSNVTLLTFFDLFMRFQPLSILIHDARRAAIFPLTIGIPTVEHAVGFTVFCLALFVGGTIVFMKRSKFFLQEY